MDLDEAAAAVAGQPRVSSLGEVREKLSALHSDHPQRHLLAQHALDEVEAALGRLAGLGHRFFLSESDPAPVEAFPAMVYKDGAGGEVETAVAEDEDALGKMLKDGWRKHPSSARAEEAAPAATISRRGAVTKEETD